MVQKAVAAKEASLRRVVEEELESQMVQWRLNRQRKAEKKAEKAEQAEKKRKAIGDAPQDAPQVIWESPRILTLI